MSCPLINDEHGVENHNDHPDLQHLCTCEPTVQRVGKGLAFGLLQALGNYWNGTAPPTEEQRKTFDKKIVTGIKNWNDIRSQITLAPNAPQGAITAFQNMNDSFGQVISLENKYDLGDQSERLGEAEAELQALKAQVEALEKENEKLSTALQPVAQEQNRQQLNRIVPISKNTLYKLDDHIRDLKTDAEGVLNKIYRSAGYTGSALQKKNMNRRIDAVEDMLEEKSPVLVDVFKEAELINGVTAGCLADAECAGLAKDAAKSGNYKPMSDRLVKIGFTRPKDYHVKKVLKDIAAGKLKPKLTKELGISNLKVAYQSVWEDVGELQQRDILSGLATVRLKDWIKEGGWKQMSGITPTDDIPAIKAKVISAVKQKTIQDFTTKRSVRSGVTVDIDVGNKLFNGLSDAFDGVAEALHEKAKGNLRLMDKTYKIADNVATALENASELMMSYTKPLNAALGIGAGSLTTAACTAWTQGTLVKSCAIAGLGVAGAVPPAIDYFRS